MKQRTTTTRSRRTPRRWLGLILLAAMLLPPAEAATAAAFNQYYVEETGHTFTDPFLSAWAALAGAESLGLPVSEAVEVDERPAQYFQRGVLRAKSVSETDPQVYRLKAGRDLLGERHDPERAIAGRRIGGDRGGAAFLREGPPDDGRIRYDERTRHTISGRILAYYDRHGGVDRFGHPLSESYVTRGMRVQWFEYGRIQWRLPDEGAVAAPVGIELAVERGVDLDRARRASLPVFDLERFRAYQGDGTIAEAPVPFEPVEIRIPTIGVTAGIEQVAIVDGVMGEPQDVWKVGWYPALPAPGQFSNVVMAGHKDWWNVGPVVFWNLELLEPGDPIYVLGPDGRGVTYVVTEKWLIDGDTHAGEVVGDTGYEALTLITCGGSFNGSEYESRWIVRAERI